MPIYNMVMAEKVYYRGEGDENTFHNTEVDRLREAEDAAGEDFSEFSNGDYNSEMNNRRSAENRPILLNGRPVDGNGNEIQHHTNSGYWRGKGREANEVNPGAMKKKRRFGPAALIIMALFGAGGVAFMGTSLGPFALVGNALDQFNVMRTAMNRRSTYFMRFQMDETLNTSLTNRRFGIFSAEKFKISNKMQKKLAKQSIEYKEDPDTKARYLVYTNQDTGEVSAVVANDGDMQKLTGKTLTNKDGASAGKLMMMDDALGSDDNFFAAHQSATKTMKGHIVGWFESLTEAFHSRIKASRNRFFGTTDETDEDEIKKKAKATGLAEDVGDSDGNARERDDDSDENGKKKVITGYDEVDDPDNPGQKIQVPIEEEVDTTKPITGSEALTSGADASQVESALKTRVDKVSSLMGGVSSAQGLACGVINALSALNIAISGIQVAKTLNFVTGMLEAIQRTQIGDGGSEMMVYFNEFAEAKETEVWSGSGTSIDKQVTSNKSTMASTAYNAQFGGPEVDSNDEKALKFNRDEAMKNALKSVMGDSWFTSLLGDFGAGASSLTVYKTCLYSGLALNAVGTVVDIVLLVVTGGIGNAIKSFVGGLVKAGIKAAIGLAVGLAISWLVPKVAQLLATDLIENIGGEDAANAMRSGFNIYMGKSMEANSGAVGDEAAVLAMYSATQDVLADDAKYDRMTRSPFDPTSKYTFIGSIAYKMMPIANMLAGSSALGSISSMMSSVSKSALSILPSASAASKTWYDKTLNKDCANLKDLNLVGDAYCNPYYTTDFSTIHMDPYKVVENVGDENFEDGEVDNPAIKQDSDLGKYIIACTLRDAQYGVKDAAVMSWIENPTGNSTINAVIDAGTGLIPVIGNLYDAAQQTSELSNMAWNTGQACIQNDEINPYWQKNKYYQRYIEDQTLMEAAGIIDKSSVTAFVEKYYEQNPIDNSLEGVIARYSGMSKEQASNTVALAEYIDFLANYNPSDSYPVPVEQEEVVAIRVYQPTFVDQSVEVASVKHITYVNLRDRVVAMA